MVTMGAYRKPPSLFRMVPLMTHLRPLPKWASKCTQDPLRPRLSQNGGHCSLLHCPRATSRLVLPSGEQCHLLPNCFNPFFSSSSFPLLPPTPPSFLLLLLFLPFLDRWQLPYILAYKSLLRISPPPLKIESVCGPKSLTRI